MAKSALLYDTFAATSGKWYSTNAATGVLSGGLMRIKPTSGYDYVGSSNAVDFTDSYLSFKLVQNSVLGLGSNSMTLTAKVDATNWVEFVINGGRTYANNATVTMRERVAGVDSDTTFRYDPAVHIWFRLRESDGTLFWETSVDGVTWTVRRSKTTTLTLTSVEVLMVGGFWAAEAGTTFATIDDFNLFAGPPPLKASVFTDEFNTVDPVLWYMDGPSVSGGRLNIVPSTGYRYALSSESWNLTDDHFLVQLVENATGLTVTSEFTARLDASNGFQFIIPGNATEPLILREKVAGVNSDVNVPFKPSLYKWFRLRHGSGQIHWEVSRDGATWSILRSKTSVLSVTAMFCMISVGYYGVEPSPGTARFDNLNVPNLQRLREIGWYVGTALPFGGVESGTVQQKVFFEDADWIWEPIPASPVLDTNSAAIVAELSTGMTSAGTWDYGVKIVKPSDITPSTPRYVFQLDYDPEWGPSPLGTMQVPMPDGVVIPPGSDGHLVVMDEAAGKVFSFWQAYKDGSVWRASWGGVSDFDGDGRDYAGNATGSSLSRLAAVVLLNEIAAGEIPHALFFATNMASPAFKYPAQKSDGINMTGAANPLWEGARVQLDPSINLAAIPGITPAELTIGRALQRYGAYCGDNGGTRIGLILEFEGVAPAPGPTYIASGLEWDYFDMTHIPWESLRVLKNWDGSA